MSAGFFKRNEKVLMTLLLLVLAPAFAFTGIMTWYLTQGRLDAEAVYEIFGSNYSRAKFIELSDERGRQTMVNGARSYGPYFRPPKATEPQALEYIMQLHEIERLGLRLSEAEEQEALRSAALDVISWARAINKPTFTGINFQQDQSIFIAERGSAGFNKDEYRKAISEGRIGLRMSVADFEDTVRTIARVGMLGRIVSTIPAVPESEIYDEFYTDRHGRRFDYVQVPIDRFLEEAGEMDEEFIRSVYDDNPFPYRKNAALSLRIARADRQKFYDLDFRADPDALQARWERDKQRYKRPRAADWVKPENYDPADDYRNLIEVFEIVEKSLSDDDAIAREKAVLEAAIVRAGELAASGEEWKLEDSFTPEDMDKIIFADTGWFERSQITTLPREFVNHPVLSGMFNVLDPGSVGQVGTETVAVQTGSYIYRISGAQEARAQTFEEAIVQVTENAKNEKARELASAYIGTWVERIRAEPETTLQTMADGENYTIHSTERPLSQYESRELLLDGKPLAAGSLLLRAVFSDCEEIGDVTEPVVLPRDQSAYVAVLQGFGDPDMKVWNSVRQGLESRVLNRRRTAIASQFWVELERRAQIKPLWNPTVEDGG